MPRTRRSATVPAPPHAVWSLVSDPRRRPAWWPRVARVENAGDGAWTDVLTSGRGRSVRADLRMVDAEEPSRCAWTQELDDGPFARLLAELTTEVEIAPQGHGASLVTLTVRHRPRGWARLDLVLMRRAAGRLLDDALRGLRRALA